MSERQHTLESEVAYLKGLAEAGRAAPLQTGPYLIAGGSWFGGASALLSLSQLRVIGLPESAIWWVWIVAALGFGATLFALIRRDGAQGEPGHNFLINAAWSGAGFGIFTFWAAATLMAIQLNTGVILSTMSLLVLVMYGVVWWITGTLTSQVWMRTIAFISFAATVPVAVAAGSAYEWLAYTSALVSTALLPGIYLVHNGGRMV